MREPKAKKLTFFSKDPIACPVCEASFYREDLLSGSGRLIAGELTDEMRRLYQPSKKFGAVYPLIYPVLVCPECYYAAYAKDFTEVAVDAEATAKLAHGRDQRISSANSLFGKLNFVEPRGLEGGAASYLLSLMSYDHVSKKSSPSIKQAMSALRGAWVCGDLHRKSPSENYDHLSKLLYRKARFLYQIALEREQTGEESMSAVAFLGPDLDKNYGYEGVLYITGLMEYKYGPKKDGERRVLNLDKARKIVARVHGMGRASKNKPSVMLDKAKDLYRMMTDAIKELKGDDAED